MPSQVHRHLSRSCAWAPNHYFSNRWLSSVSPPCPIPGSPKNTGLSIPPTLLRAMRKGIEREDITRYQDMPAGGYLTRLGDYKAMAIDFAFTFL